ncbi:hypothetical protein K7X08_035590 [Anisodus acutangulus]|uniref:Uncharacterized protein n=1 Tax=Anisodus acutangulus TaxID=402998 RepID=A0A9Q1LHU0_9SOLA|nr:hypothetical protein K7X08_035590 [Anisodus acutangulus]
MQKEKEKDTPDSNKIDIIEDKQEDEHNTDRDNTSEHYDMAIGVLTRNDINLRKFTDEDIEELIKQILEMEEGIGDAGERDLEK